MPSAAMSEALAAMRRRQVANKSAPPVALAEARAHFTPGDVIYPIPDDVLVHELSVGGVPAFWLDAPGVDAHRALLFLHDGGFQFGSLAGDGELASRIGRAAGMRVLFLEYRLAPENAFPAALDDVRSAWSWLRTEQNFDVASLAVAGASAGGGLAVSLLVATRDTEGASALPAAVVLMSPTVDLTSSGRSMTERVDQDPISTPELLRRLAADYLQGADPRDQLASPLFAPLAGLPPMLIQEGTADLLLSDAERLAQAASEQGVDVTIEIGEGLPHVYQLIAGTPEATQATERIGRFLREKVR